MSDEKIINFDKEFEDIKDDLKENESNLLEIQSDEAKERAQINDLINRVEKLAKNANINIIIPTQLEIREINLLNNNLNEILTVDFKKHSKFPELSSADIVISSVAGIIAVVIDVILVGTPDIVKIYKGGDKFDGSLLTEAIRKLGDGQLKPIFEWLSEECKVSYDISAIKDGMYPQNHRLRSLGHDPFFGLFFAVFDILMDTTTYVDNNGMLKITKNTRHNSSSIQKMLPVIYYMGHIISDLFTARGIPVPGFFLTQFFIEGVADNSLAKKAEEMYLNGYDMRHLASMTTPVVVKNMIINVYLELIKEDYNKVTDNLFRNEKKELDIKLKKTKMLFISDSIAVGGNLIKFFAPPSCSNPNSLNTVEWLAFLNSSISIIKASTRDFNIEKVDYNRKELNDIWDLLLK